MKVVRQLLWAVPLLVVAALVVGIIALRPELPCGPSLSKSRPLEKPADLVLVLLDLSDNSEESAEAIIRVVGRHLHGAARDGAYVKAVATHGDGQRAEDLRCLAGDELLYVEGDNEQWEENLTRAKVSVLTEHLREHVLGAEIGVRGSATRLLASAPQHLAAMAEAVDGAVGEKSVVLWSDLLGATDQSDCLNLDGQTASGSTAEALVLRCFAEGQLPALGDVNVRLEGVAYSARGTPETLLARYLASHLCHRLSRSCSMTGESP